LSLQRKQTPNFPAPNLSYDIVPLADVLYAVEAQPQYQKRACSRLSLSFSAFFFEARHDPFDFVVGNVRSHRCRTVFGSSWKALYT